MTNIQNGAVLGADEQRAEEGLEAEERGKRIRSLIANPDWEEVAGYMDTSDVADLMRAICTQGSSRDVLNGLGYALASVNVAVESWAASYVDSE